MALGTRAAATSRGANSKGVIRHGARGDCHIRVTIDNSGTDGYKRSLFGNRITVERVITQYVSSCKQLWGRS